MKFHHVALIVTDRTRALRFYREALGFTLAHEAWRAERNSWKLDLEREGMRLELFTFEGSPARASYPENLGLRHLCFEVKEIEEFHRELREKGFEAEEIRVDPYTRKKFFFFSDPDGQPLEIYQA